MIRRFLLLCLVLVLMLGASLPAYAATEFDAYMLRNSSSQTWTGAAGSHSVSAGTYIAVLMQQLLVYLGLDLDAIDTHIYDIYTRLGSVVTSLSNIDSTLTSSSTTLSNIYTSLNVTLKNILNGAASSLTSIDTKLNTSNSRLSSIISNQGTIYNYLSSGDLQVSLDSEVETTISGILSNTDSLPTINSLLNSVYKKTDSSSFSYNYRRRLTDDFSSNSLTSNQSSYIIFNQSWANNRRDFRPVNVSNYSLYDYLFLILRNFNSLEMGLFTVDTIYRSNIIDSSLTSSTNYYFGSLADFLNVIINEWDNPLKSLAFVLADENSVQLKKDNSSLASGIYDDFSGSGSNAASLSDVQLLSSGASDLKDSVSGVSASGVFGVLSDGDSWGWFSNAVKNDMDSVSSSNSQVRVMRSSRSSDRSVSLSLYDQYYSDLYDLLGLNGD